MLVGRKSEKTILSEFLDSNQAEFLAVYGRRRVGKTFLIREFFSNKKCVFFNTTGMRAGTRSEQIAHFMDEVGRVFYQGAALETVKTWNAAFNILTKALSGINKNKKIVLFLDEFPWMATRKSRLLENLEYYWNQHWSNQKNIKLIICGSSASWIINKIINNKGGLHNRVTTRILLEPFCLSETRDFLISKGISLNHQQILQLYMSFGGIPFYLNQVKKGLSAAQNIDKLCFRREGLLFNEFENLFASLFQNEDLYIQVIRLIAKHQYGLGQEELFNKLDKNIKGKLGIQILKDLEDSGFIMNFKPYFNKKRGIYYKVIDEYTIFYLTWIEPIKNTLLARSLAGGFFENRQNSPVWHAWAGLAFESLCYKHIAQIQEALELRVSAIPSTWRHVPKKDSQEQGAQIDLLFDREDDAITLCEIKYTESPFLIDKSYAESLKQKISVFKNITQTEKQIFLIFISANGLKKNAYSEELVSKVLNLDVLFNV
ncbi:MAG: AAA family ATPase [Gammaproteobacteria bacterium]